MKQSSRSVWLLSPALDQRDLSAAVLIRVPDNALTRAQRCAGHGIHQSVNSNG
jgi:hypothetical protein